MERVYYRLAAGSGLRVGPISWRRRVIRQENLDPLARWRPVCAVATCQRSILCENIVGCRKSTPTLTHGRCIVIGQCIATETRPSSASADTAEPWACHCEIE